MGDPHDTGPNASRFRTRSPAVRRDSTADAAPVPIVVRVRIRDVDVASLERWVAASGTTGLLPGDPGSRRRGATRLRSGVLWRSRDRAMRTSIDADPVMVVAQGWAAT